MKVNVIFMLLSMALFFSCSDDISKDDQENKITIKVFSNTPGVPIIIPDYFGGGSLIIKDQWEGSFTTKSYATSFYAMCKDRTVLMTCEIYVNGKLKMKRDGNGSINLTVKLK